MRFQLRSMIGRLFVRGVILRMKTLGVFADIYAGIMERRTESIKCQTRKLGHLTSSLKTLSVRLEDLAAEAHSLNGQPLFIKKQLLPDIDVAKTAVLEQVKPIQRAANRIKKKNYRVTSLFADYAALYMDESFSRTKQSGDSLIRIISNTDSPTYYWDLLVWLLVPGLHSEELLGDLKEEYLLRLSDSSQSAANAWYQHQVLTTIMQYTWKRIERTAAIATLIDLLHRWLKK